MVRFGFAVLTSACLLSSAGAAEGLVALFDAQSHDFGNVPVGPTVNHGFTLKNTTNQTLQIGGLRVSCGCTTPTVSATVIPPGKTAVLNAAMDTRRFVGAKTVTIFVTFTQPHFEETRLSVSALSRNDIAMNPDRLDFGQVRKGAPATASTTISFTSGMRVTEANSESGYVQLSFKEPKQTQWGLSYELTAKLRSDIPAGRWITDVWVKTDNNTRLRIPVTVEVEAALSLAPSMVQFDGAKVGLPVKKAIVVKGALPFKILEVKGGDGVLQAVAASNESKTTHLVTVTFTPGKEGDFAKSLEIITDLKEEGKVELSVKGKAMP